MFEWATFTAAADEAGMSGRYGGIYFARADLGGRMLGGLVGAKAWAKAQTYFDGTASPPIQVWKAISEASWNIADPTHNAAGDSNMKRKSSQ